ncbi:hypothetical protein Tco_1253936 [Tanacetum coccineum]
MGTMWCLYDPTPSRYEIDRVTDGKLRDKNVKDSWEIIEDLALYDHEGWNDPRDFAKQVKAISLPQDTLRTLDRRLLELEDQISFLLKGSRTTPRTSSTLTQSYAKAISSNPHSRNLDQLPRLDTPITKNVNLISLVKMEKKKNIENNKVVDKNVVELSELNAIKPKEVVDMKKDVEDGANDEPVRNMEE